MEKTEIIEILKSCCTYGPKGNLSGFYIDRAAEALTEPEGKKRDFYRCKCDVPFIEAGFDYCERCHSHVPPDKMEAILAQQKEEDNEKDSISK